MERRGIQTEKGNVNRQIAADNKLLAEIKARITRLYSRSKEQSEAKQAQDSVSVLAQLYQAQAAANSGKAKFNKGKVNALKQNAALFNFLQENGITSMQQLYEKIANVNAAYYNLRGNIVNIERRISALTERLEMFAQYEKYKSVRKAMDGMKPKKRKQYQQEKESELAAFNIANRFLRNLKETGEAITPKQWHSEKEKLTEKKDAKYAEMRAMREDIKSLESLRKAADRLSRNQQHQQHQQKGHHR